MSQNMRQLLSPKATAIGDLELREIRNEIQVKGCDCTWSKATPCPCYRIGTLEGSTVPDASTTTPQGECPACSGTGWVYYGAQTSRFLITSATDRFDLEASSGMATPGSFNVSAFVENPLGLGDRLIVNEAVRVVVQQKIREAGTVDTLRFPIIRKAWTLGTALNPTVPETVTIGVDYLIAANLSTGAIVGGATPTEYVEGVNFTVPTSGGNTGKIDWTIGGASVPSVGARYTARYYARPNYIISNLRYAHRQLGFIEKRPAREVIQLFWQGTAVLDSLGVA